MTRDELLRALFPGGHAVQAGAHGTLHGRAALPGGRAVAVLGIGCATPLGIDAAILLAGQVLAIVREGGGTPLILLVDSASQAMAKRDEMLGLNEYLAHLSKCLWFAAARGHRTISVLHGAAAAGAFIATALSTEALLAVAGADPSVMDLPSIARITKLPINRLQEMAADTAIFAPGIGPLTATGAVAEHWDDPAGFAQRLEALLGSLDPADQRDRLGRERGGRTKAFTIARRVEAELRTGA